MFPVLVADERFMPAKFEMPETVRAVEETLARELVAETWNVPTTCKVEDGVADPVPMPTWPVFFMLKIEVPVADTVNKPLAVEVPTATP
jgi:hypothetical protein